MTNQTSEILHPAIRCSGRVYSVAPDKSRDHDNSNGMTADEISISNACWSLHDTIAAHKIKLKQPCVSFRRQTNCRLPSSFPVHDMPLCFGRYLFATRGVKLRENMIVEPWKERFIKSIARLAEGLMDEPGQLR